MLGTCHENGIGVPLDAAKAAKLYRSAADLGHAPAQHSLGLLYWSGVGVEKSEETAVDWFKRSAKQGFWPAQEDLGNCLSYGVISDPIEALFWFQKAAENGSASAKLQVALMHQQGTGTPVNRAEYLNWLEAASHAGDADAAFAFALELLSGATADKESYAFSWLVKAADWGSALANSRLSLVFEFGQMGQGIDRKKSQFYQERAERIGKEMQGEPSAQ